MKPNHSVGRRLKFVRESLGKSLNEVAAETGITKSHIWGVEEGRADITVGKLQPLLSAYGLTWSFIDGVCPHEYACIRCGVALEGSP